MARMPLTHKQYTLTLDRACQELCPDRDKSNRAWYQTRTEFKQVDHALAKLEAAGLKQFGGQELIDLIMIQQRSGSPQERLANTTVNIKQCLKGLHQALYERNDHNLLNEAALASYLKIIKYGWKNCSEKGYNPYDFASNDRFYLALTLKQALSIVPSPVRS